MDFLLFVQKWVLNLGNRKECFCVFCYHVELTGGAVLCFILLDRSRRVDVGDENMLNWTRAVVSVLFRRV